MTDPRDELIAELRRQLAERDVIIAELRAELAALKEAFAKSSRNSSKPLSRNTQSTRQRDAVLQRAFSKMAGTSGRVVPQIRSVLEAAGRSIVVETKRFVGHHHGIEITPSFNANAVDTTVIDHALRPRRDNCEDRQAPRRRTLRAREPRPS